MSILDKIDKLDAANRDAKPCERCGCPFLWEYLGGLHCYECDPPPSKQFVQRRLMVVHNGEGNDVLIDHDRFLAGDEATGDPQTDDDDPEASPPGGDDLGWARPAGMDFETWWRHSPLLDRPRHVERRCSEARREGL